VAQRKLRAADLFSDTYAEDSSESTRAQREMASLMASRCAALWTDPLAMTIEEFLIWTHPARGMGNSEQQDTRKRSRGQDG
jgi:hypothetical protein